MPNLRNLQVGQISPTMSTAATPTVDWSSTVGSALGSVANALEADTVADRQAATAAAKLEHDTALGNALGQTLATSETFLVASAEDELARNQVAEASTRAESEGVQVGESGTETLGEATRLARVEGYLRESGQMNTLHQIKLLRQQQNLIARRPDLGEDIVKITNAAATDANAILKRNEDEQRSLRVKETDERRTQLTAIVTKANQYDPNDTIADMAAKAENIQWPLRQLDVATREVALLRLDDEAAGFRDNTDRRSLEADKRNVERKVFQLSSEKVVPMMKLDLLNSVEPFRQLDGDETQKAMRWDNLVQSKVVQIESTFPPGEARNDAIRQTLEFGALNRDYASGKADTEGRQRAGQDLSVRAKLAVLDPDNPFQTYIAENAYALSPALTAIMGSAEGQKFIGDVLTPILMAGDPSGQAVTNLTGGKPRRPADPGSDSPFLNPGQKPRDVSPAQVKERRGQILSGIQAVGQTPSPSSGLKMFAAEGLVKAFNDPVVTRDSENTRNVILGLSNPSIAKAYEGNEYAGQAQDVAFDRIHDFFAVVEAQAKDSRGTPLAGRFTYKWDPTSDRLVATPTPPSGQASYAPITNATLAKLTTEGTAAIRAWAHLQGSTDYNAAAEDFWSRSQ